MRRKKVTKAGMSIDRAKTKVREAMRVIVDFMVGENSSPMEGYQSKYDKVSAIDDEVIEALGKADIKEDKIALEYYRLAKDIKVWAKDHLSFMMGEACPQRWMFKTIF